MSFVSTFFLCVFLAFGVFGVFGVFGFVGVFSFFRFFLIYFSKECVYCGVVPRAPQQHSRIHSAS